MISMPKLKQLMLVPAVSVALCPLWVLLHHATHC